MDNLFDASEKLAAALRTMIEASRHGPRCDCGTGAALDAARAALAEYDAAGFTLGPTAVSCSGVACADRRLGVHHARRLDCGQTTDRLTRFAFLQLYTPS